MLSLQSMASRAVSNVDGTWLSRRRKRGDHEQEQLDDCCFRKMAKLVRSTTENYSDSESSDLDAPLSSEWQRRLDVKSGKVQYYNTETKKSTFQERTLRTKQAWPCLSLDLELSLATEPPRARQVHGEMKELGRGVSYCDDDRIAKYCSSSGISSIDADKAEMVATACMRCHMLVMMCKATLSCPNCKFVHP